VPAPPRSTLFPYTTLFRSDWEDVLHELPIRVRDWMDRLEREGVRGADLVFACIGPALEIFSRYSRVETAEGDEVPLSQYLEKVRSEEHTSELQSLAYLVCR